MTSEGRPAPKILVGAGSFVDAETAVRIAERLAIDLSAGLGGVLVEETNMLAICELPNQRVILASGATVQAPDRMQFQTLMHADARAFQKSLARSAQTAGAEWVFVRDTGDLVGTSLRVAMGWDILVIGYRKVHTIPGKIILLQGGAAPSEDMKKAARVLTQRLSADLLVFTVGRDRQDPPDAPPPVPQHFETLHAAMAVLARTNAQAVLVDLAQGPIRDPDVLARLLEVSRCPLVVFGASKTNVLLGQGVAIPNISDNGNADQ